MNPPTIPRIRALLTVPADLCRLLLAAIRDARRVAAIPHDEREGEDAP